jgi:autotransporter-associated beta strand protein
LELAANSTVLVSDSGMLTLDGAISGSGMLTKTGDGLLVLANSTTYSGDTKIAGGTLALDLGGQIVNSNIDNDANFQIVTGVHDVNHIFSSGATHVLSGSLTASSIVQQTLTNGNMSASFAGGSSDASVPEPGILTSLASVLLGKFLALVFRQFD